jgi:hypothetical protein
LFFTSGSENNENKSGKITKILKKKKISFIKKGVGLGLSICKKLAGYVGPNF